MQQELGVGDARKRSSIWLHFTQVNSTNARCNLCKTCFSYKGGSTSNLAKHLKLKHTLTIEPHKKLSKETLHLPSDSTPSTSQAAAATSATGTLNSGNESIPVPDHPGPAKKKNTQQLLNAFVRQPVSIVRQKKIDDLVLGMVVKDFQPFSIVEDEGFKDLLRYIEPNYEMISRYRLTSNLLPQRYEALQCNLKEELKEVKFISLTTDAWTSTAMQSYVAVTGHYINKQWELKSALLDCIYMPESHTAQNLRTRLIESMKVYGLEEKVVAVTTDNAANIVAAIKITGWNHVPCSAHTINLVVQDGIKNSQVALIVKKIKSVVEHFRRSSTASEKLKAMQSQMNPSSAALKVIMDVATRWNSTFYMMERFQKLKEPLNATLGALQNPVTSLMADEWLLLDEIIEILRPFELLTKEFSAEKYITISKIIVLVDGARVVLRKIMKSDLSSSFGKDFSIYMDSILMQRFVPIYKNYVVQIATTLDPRFKTKVLQEETRRITKANLQEELKLLCPSSTRPNTESEINKNDNMLWNFFDESIAKDFISTPTSSAIKELRAYHEEDLPKRKDTDPLAYWKTREAISPGLATLAKKYLCVVGSSVPSERVFSKTGLIISDRRTRLKPENVKMIVFLNANT